MQGVTSTGAAVSLAVDSSGALTGPTGSVNVISTANSTTANLANDAVYTGTGEDVSAYNAVTILVDSSHDSATDGMTFQFSSDDSNYSDVNTYTYTAADGARRFQFPVVAQYFRVVYTNGGTTQTGFEVQTILHTANVLQSIHRLVDSVDPDRSAQLTKSIIIAQGAGSGDFIPVQATAGGNLKHSLEEIDASLLGGGAEASGLLVTLANDSTGLLSVDDNAGSLTVDAPVGTPVFVRLSNGSTAVDAAVMGTATYTEATTTGNLISAVRNDTLDALADTDNELGPLQTNALGALHVSNPPIQEQAVLSLFDGSAETQIAPTNFGASKSITVSGSGKITKMCVIFTAGTLTEADDGVVYFFDADPTFTIETADLTVAEAQTVVGSIRVTTEDYDTQFATAQVACLDELDSAFHSITHVAYLNTDAGTLTDEDIEIHFWYERAN
jgi:hypothetical protein